MLVNGFSVGSAVIAPMMAQTLSGPSMPFLRYFSLHEIWPAGPLVLLAGLVMLGLHLFLLLRGKKSLEGLHAFPRNWTLGIVLTAVCVPWFSLLLLYNIPFPALQKYKDVITLLSLALLFPIVVHLKNLLSVRALGCLLLLLGAPILAAIRPEETMWARWIVATWVYSFVILGMILVLYPYRFRRWVKRFLDPSASRKILAISGLSVGLLLIGSSFAFF